VEETQQMRKVLKHTAPYVAAILFGGLFAGGAAASPLTGMLFVNGNVTVTSTAIEFNPMGSINLEADPFNNTGSFMALNTGMVGSPDTGTITSLTGGPLTGTLATPVTPFITFDTGGLDFELNLTYINPSNIGNHGAGCTDVASNAAAGNTCQLPNSPFNLIDQASGSTIDAVLSFGVAGNVVNLASGGTTAFTGSFSETVDGTSYEQILADIQGSPGSFTTNFSANFTAAPEPGTMGMLLIGIAMVAIAGLAGRRHRRNTNS
jgi:hypothetical protein